MDSSSFPAEYVPFVLFGVFAAIIIVAMYVSWRNEQRRQDELARFAESAGLELVDASAMYAPEHKGFWDSLFESTTGDDVFASRFEGFEPFGQGYDREANNLMIGSKDGIDWYMFDYKYSTGSGKSKQTFNYAIIGARVPYVFPHLVLKPETFFTKLGQHMGMRELKFELDEFNSRYFITCSDDKVAYDILSPQMIEYLMKQETRWWQFFGPHILIAEWGSLDAGFCYQVMHEVTEMVSNLPNYVRQDLGFKPKWKSALE